jgi:hypothetical protein
VQNALTEAERAALRRILPQTTRLDAPYDLTGLMHERSDSILKPTTLARGEGTVAGWTVDDTTWREALTTAARNGRYIVQRRVVPRAEPGYDEQGSTVRDWHAVWGMHYGPAGLTGLTSRLVKEASAVIRGTGRPVLLAPVFLNSGTHSLSDDRDGMAVAEC